MKRDQSARGRYSRNKGKRWEQQVARDMRITLAGDAVERGWQAHMGSLHSDVVTGPFSIECKVGASPPIRSALKQAVECAGPGRWAVAAVKTDREDPIAVMPWADFLDLVGEWWDLVEK